MAEYIERKKAINIIRKHWVRNDGDTACQKAIDELRSCKAVNTRAAKNGTWLELDNRMTICSECNSFGCN